MAPFAIYSRGVLHGLPDFIRRLYDLARATTGWSSVPGFHLIVFLGLVVLLYFVLSLPVRLVELALSDRKGHESEGVLRRLLSDQPVLSPLPKVLSTTARFMCFVGLWWLLDRTLDFIF